MKHALRRMRFVSLALFLATIVMSAGQGLLAAEPAADSEQINGLFQRVKESSAQLNRDAHELVTFQKSRISWETHARQLDSIKDHVNKIGKLEQELRDARESGSPWQQEAIGRVNPLLQELADNLEGTINHMNNNRNALFVAPYPEYVETNAELATELHSMISDFVAYGKTKQKFQTLQQKLELSER